MLANMHQEDIIPGPGPNRHSGRSGCLHEHASLSSHWIYEEPLGPREAGRDRLPRGNNPGTAFTPLQPITRLLTPSTDPIHSTFPLRSLGHNPTSPHHPLFLKLGHLHRNRVPCSRGPHHPALGPAIPRHPIFLSRPARLHGRPMDSPLLRSCLRPRRPWAQSCHRWVRTDTHQPRIRIGRARGRLVTCPEGGQFLATVSGFARGLWIDPIWAVVRE